MLLIPQRLFRLESVHTILTDGASCILRKQMTEETSDRNSYIGTTVISYVRQGKQQIQNYDGAYVELPAGSFAILPKGIYTISDLIPQKGHFETLLFFFSDSVIDRFLSDQKVSVNTTGSSQWLHANTFNALEIYTETLLQLYSSTTVDGAAITELKLLEMLHLMQASGRVPNLCAFLANTRIGKTRNLLQFMESNYDRPLKVEDYAHLTGRSLSAFRRDFKQSFQISPQQWLRERRLEKAHGLLLEEKHSITEIAYEVGYENISYFIKAFKEKYKQTPKQFALARQSL